MSIMKAKIKIYFGFLSVKFVIFICVICKKGKPVWPMCCSSCAEETKFDPKRFLKVSLNIKGIENTQSI